MNIHPSEILTEILRERNECVNCFASRSGIPRKKLQRFLSKDINIDEEMAIKLGYATDTNNSVGIWMSLGRSYEASKVAV